MLPLASLMRFFSASISSLRDFSAAFAFPPSAPPASSVRINEVRQTCVHISVRWIAFSQILLKGYKVQVGFLYSAAYAMTGPARFIISEVAVDWQNPMVLQRKLRPFNCTRYQLDPRYAASKHITVLINHTRPSPRNHSPDVATPARKQTSNYSLLLNISTSKG